jgi:trehalose 6-phosphate phosphatase
MIDAAGLVSDLTLLSADRAQAALFFDIDGVLAPIRPRPEQAEIPEETRSMLARLAETYGLVAVVSGRSLRSADAMVGIRSVVVVGDHGREMRDSRGRISSVSDVDTAPLRLAAAEFSRDPRILAAGVRVEEKPGGVALHTRGLDRPEEALKVALEVAAERADASGLVAREGRMVVELRPPGVDKGSAVEVLLDRASSRAALYVGDDSTDVDAMRVLARRRSSGLHVLLVGVRSGEMPEGLSELADHLVGQGDVPWLLAQLLEGVA